MTTTRILRPLAVLAGVAILVTAGPVGSAGATSQHGKIKTARLPAHGFYTIATGGAGTFVADTGETDISYLRKIDPQTTRVTHTWRTDSSAGGIAVSKNAVWLSMYYANTVERIDPSNGKRIATIRVGYQPEAVDVAFGSVWVGAHHESEVQRIDEKTNRVVATIKVGDSRSFRDGPQWITSDAHHLYVSTSNGGDPLTTIDPTTNRIVRAPATPSQFCGNFVVTHGTAWSADDCSNAMYRLRRTSGKALVTLNFGPGQIEWATVVHGHLWVCADAEVNQETGVGSQGFLEQLNPKTGAVLRKVVIGGDADDILGIDGQLWVVDYTHGVLRHTTLS